MLRERTLQHPIANGRSAALVMRSENNCGVTRPVQFATPLFTALRRTAKAHRVSPLRCCPGALRYGGALQDYHTSTSERRTTGGIQWKAPLLVAAIGLIGVTGSEVIVGMEPGKLEPNLQTSADDQAPGEAEPAGKVPSSNPLSGDPE